MKEANAIKAIVKRYAKDHLDKSDGDVEFDVYHCLVLLYSWRLESLGVHHASRRDVLRGDVQQG